MILGRCINLLTRYELVSCSFGIHLGALINTNIDITYKFTFGVAAYLIERYNKFVYVGLIITGIVFTIKCGISDYYNISGTGIIIQYL